MKKIVITALSALLLLHTSPFALSMLNYLAYNNSELSHRVVFNISTSQNIVKIQTHATAETLKETTICTLSATTNQLLSVTQNTENDTDKAYFNWKIFPKNGSPFLIYEDIKNDRTWSEPWRLKENSYPIQALVYTLQNLPLYEGYTFKCRLIAPPKDEYPMVFKVLEETYMHYENKRKACYKIEATFNQLFGLFLPKTYFWVTVEKPHIPIQYQDQRFTYKLHNYR